MDPIEVQGPDGQRYQFPAGTSPDVMKQAMATRYPKPSEPSFSGGLIPATRDASGTHFDPRAGFLSPTGAVGDMIAGKLDPMSQEGIESSLPLALMGLGAAPGMRSGAEGMFGGPMKTAPVPSSAALKEAAETGYTAFRDAGVDFKADAVANMAQRLKSHLIESSINEKIAPAVFKTLDELASPPAGAVAQGSDLLAARASFEDARLDFTHPRQRLAAEKAIAQIDALLSGSNSGAIRPAPGQTAEDATANAVKAGQAYGDANADYAAAKRSEKLTGTAAERANRKPGVLESAELSAAAANSGRNVGNSIRQGVKGLLKNPKERAGYSPEDIKQLEGVSRGSLGRNAARYSANALGGGGGLAQMLLASVGAGIGGTFGGIPGALIGQIPVAAGYGLKSLENSLTKKALEAVATKTRTRSPLYEELLKQALPPKVRTKAGRAALLKALMTTPVPPIPMTEPYSPYKT